MHTMHTYLSLLFFLYFRLLHSTYYCSSATDWQLHPALTTTYLSRGFFEQYIICICMSRCILHLSSFTTYVHLLFPSFKKREREIICLLFFFPQCICRVMLVSFGVGLPTSLKRLSPSFGPPSVWFL